MLEFPLGAVFKGPFKIRTLTFGSSVLVGSGK